MRRIPPYIDCILHYYLMETCGQVACTARTRGTIGGGTGGTPPFLPPPRRGHREARGWACINHTPIPPVFERTDQADGDLRSDRVHGEDATHPFHGGHRRHDREGTGGTIRGPLILAESANEADSALHRLHSSLSDGDLRSDRVHGEDARHNRGRYRRHDPGTIDFGGVRK